MSRSNFCRHFQFETNPIPHGGVKVNMIYILKYFWQSVIPGICSGRQVRHFYKCQDPLPTEGCLSKLSFWSNYRFGHSDGVFAFVSTMKGIFYFRNLLLLLFLLLLLLLLSPSLLLLFSSSLLLILLLLEGSFLLLLLLLKVFFQNGYLFLLSLFDSDI